MINRNTAITRWERVKGCLTCWRCPTPLPQWAEAFSRWKNGEVPVFNGDLGGWDGDSVTNVSDMFAGATDLNRWENDMSEQALDEGELIMDEKTLIGMRLEYGVLYQMHLRLAHGTKSDPEERLEHLDLASAYEIGMHLVERLLD